MNLKSWTQRNPWARMRELESRVNRSEEELAFLREVLGSVATFEVFKQVRFFKFPGGLLPVRQTEGAIGYDAYARAIVDPLSKPTPDSPLRRTIADFNKKPGWEQEIDESVRSWVKLDPNNEDKYAIALPPRESLMVGLGFATNMHFPMLYWVAPRSGYAARKITVSNSPGTVDPDYRGEAGALIMNNSESDFMLTHHMRVIQAIFMLSAIPEVVEVENYEDLGLTNRAAGGFGSTGTH